MFRFCRFLLITVGLFGVSFAENAGDGCSLDLRFSSEPLAVHKISYVFDGVRPPGYGAPPSSPTLAPCVNDQMRRIHKPPITKIQSDFSLSDDQGYDL